MLYTQRYGDWRSIEGQHSCKHTHRKRLQTAEEVDFIHPYSPYGDAAILIIDSRCHALTAAERGHGDKFWMLSPYCAHIKCLYGLFSCS